MSTDIKTLFKNHTVFHKKDASLPRIYVDGCYDMFHWGHANVIRQACAAFDYKCVSVLGICDNPIIEKHKGPTVMTEEERNLAVQSCQWVDEVVDGINIWDTDINMMKFFHINYVVHGDDISMNTVTGKNSYQEIIDAGMLKLVPRTDGVSSTDLIYRMMHSESKEHWCGLKHANLSVEKLRVFSSTKKERTKDDKIVYIDGSFDMLHAGHYELFRKAKELGTYLVVGVFDDETVNGYKGKNYPILNLGERVMGLLACRYVDDVIIGAPKGVTKEMIERMKISCVVHGKCENGIGKNFYSDAVDMGVYKEVDSGKTLTSDEIIERVKEREKLFEARNAKKIR
uniref:ethanolamine-phosphate cytidylyltransferase n=1 Tax=Entamoeba invadens TaxID=33085 RepID=S0AY32_ENTIV|nr:ethanolamine-phosphate cytidylyltransferase, putative [Entamoeba invadens]